MQLFRRKPGLRELRDWLAGLDGEDRKLVEAYLIGASDPNKPPSREALGDGQLAAAISAGLANLLKLFVEHGPELLALIKSIVILFAEKPRV